MNEDKKDKRLIEVNLPLEELSEESRSEKYRSYGRLSNLHRWWAVRPLAASRVAAYASLVKAPDDESLKEEMDNIKELASWENMHKKRVIKNAKENIFENFENNPPKVLDPFSGSGTMPLEAKRIGCESHALEYNPVAYLINQAVLSYPDLSSESIEESSSQMFKIANDESKLIRDLKKWADWVFEKAQDELAEFYGENEVAYIWVRTLPCQNPNCELDIPLTKSFWLADNDSSEKAVYHTVCSKDGSIETNIYSGDEIEELKENGRRKVEIKETGQVFDPSDGTVMRGSVSCPACGSSFKAKTTRELSKEEGFEHKLMVVVEKNEKGGKKYRVPSEKDLERFDKAKKKLNRIDEKLVPKEEIPFHEGTSRYLTPRMYGMNTWGELFNPRQRLALAIFSEKVSSVYEKISEDEEEEYAKAITTYLGLALDKVADYNSSLVAWQKKGEKGRRTFGRTALPIKWDFVEENALGDGNSGSWKAALDLLPRAIKTASGTLGKAKVNLGDASQLPYPDNHFDAVLTDPPYYDNVPYAALSDFFYVWLKRSVGGLYPDVFSTPLTPKSGEIIEDKGQHNSGENAEKFYEEKLSEAFSEIHRVLKDDGITTIVFAHKSTEAWAQMIRSLLSSELVVTATWPIHTERAVRFRSVGSAALASSVYFVCRKRAGSEIGYYSDVEEELQNRIHERLDYFWGNGIRGADMLVSAIGPAVEVFGKYKEVKRLSGEKVTVDELLEKTQRLVSDYALEKVLEEDVELGDLDPETRFYILYRWAFANQKEDYDEIRKLAQVNDANTDKLEKMGILEVIKGDATLNPPQKRTINDPEKVPEENHLPIIEKIHRAAILWESGDRSVLKEFIEKHCMSDEFWRSAQAIAECLPEEESKSKKEKQMLHGLLGYSGEADFKPSSGQAQLGLFSNQGDDE